MTRKVRSMAWCLVAGLSVWIAPSGTAGAQTVHVKLGTLAPEGSAWHEIMRDMGEQWRIASGGRVRLTIYPGGVQGNEAEMVRKMRIGQLNAAAISSDGLQTITPEPGAFEIPLLFESNEEVDYVRDRIAPRLEAALEARGFVVLNWGDAGWVRFFTNRPVSRVSELQRLKLYVGGTDVAAVELWKEAGFRVVPLAPTDILTALQTRMIDAFQAPPGIALGFQWFPLARHMVDLPLAPVIGATIISKSSWDRIDPPVRPALLEAAREAGQRLTQEIRKLEADALRAMQKRGLQIIGVPSEARQEWQQMVEAFYPRIRGELIQPQDFDEVLRLVKEYRAGRAETNHADD
jgi:TRAP-type transport system periplasmic protein